MVVPTVAAITALRSSALCWASDVIAHLDGRLAVKSGGCFPCAMMVDAVTDGSIQALCDTRASTSKH